MPHIKKRNEILIIALSLAAVVGLWFLLDPGTYWQRTATLFFCMVFLAFIAGLLYLYGEKIAKKPDVSE